MGRARDQTCSLENGQMLGDRSQTHVERLRDLRNRRWTVRQSGEYPATRAARERVKNLIEVIRDRHALRARQAIHIRRQLEC